MGRSSWVPTKEKTIRAFSLSAGSATRQMDRLTKDQRSYNMSRIRSKNTVPELTVRRLVHRMGGRYRLHDSKLPGRPDLVLKRYRKVILVHGCFWHGHSCKNGRGIPETNREYWLSKREYNRRRDKANLRKLRGDGWDVLIVWECQTRDVGALTARLRAFLRSPEDR